MAKVSMENIEIVEKDIEDKIIFDKRFGEVYDLRFIHYFDSIETVRSIKTDRNLPILYTSSDAELCSDVDGITNCTDEQLSNFISYWENLGYFPSFSINSQNTYGYVMF